MAHSTEFENPSHHYENIEADILARLKKIHQQFPERFSKQIHVLAAVDDDVNDQWEQRLQQAKENGNGERIILIPYNVGNDHWIGVLLKFKANEQIERADFIDPVEHSDFVPDKLQKQFDKIYSGVILQSRNFQKHDNPEQSATLTVENLLKAAEEAQSTDVKNSDTCCSQNQTFDDRNTSLTRNAEQTSLPSSAVFSGNNSDLDSQKQTTSSVLNSVENKDDFDLPVKVPQLEQLIEPFDNKKKNKDIKEHKKSLQEPEELPSINEPDQSKVESYEVLKKQLEDGLVKYDISTKEELKQKIIDKKERIESLRKKGNHEGVRKRQVSLSELEKLQSLMDKIEVLESFHADDECEVLKKELEDGLVKYDISKEELKQKLIDKKERIESLRKKGNHEGVRKRQVSLSELEKLQSLMDKIEVLESFHANDEYEVLKKELEDGLVEYDISTKEELKQKIIDKKEIIECLRKKGNHEGVRKRQVSLSELEKLQSLMDKIEVLESFHANDEYEVLKKELEDGLVEYDISTKEELKQKIIDKKERIESLRKKGNHEGVRKRQVSLSELEKLQSLMDKIEVLESFHANDEYEVLKKELEDGLVEYDISTKEELKQKIIDKKEIIECLRKKGNHEGVRKRQVSLSELEKLQSLMDKIEDLESRQSTGSNRFPKQQLNTDHPTDQQLESVLEETPSNIDPPREEECILTKESLKNMYQDFHLMPICAERSIISLLFYVSLKLADNTVILDGSIKIPDQIDTEIDKEFECLKERLKIEEFESKEIDYSVTAASINVKNKNWKCAITALSQLLKQLCPLDIRELFRLVEKVEEAASLIKNKEIILFLGGTGSGKSTTIHFLSGSKMVKQLVNNLNHIAPTEIKNTDLKKITTSPFARSETRYITPVKVNYSDVGAYSSGSGILCDSPGFEDTSGSEVDIANGVGIIKAIKGCKSVKPVVLISSKKIGDRCEGIKELAHILTGLIPGIKDHIGAFSYIFTKYPDKEKKTIHTSLNDVNKTLTEAEKSDIGFTDVLKDMLKKTRSSARVLNPLEDDPGQILDEFADSAFIDHPDEVFRFSITAESKAVLQQQITQNQLSIMSATKRSEYSFVKYNLDNLKRLHELLNQDYIEQIYNECVRHINKHLSDEYENGISMLDRCLMNQTILNIEDIQQYQTCIAHAKLAEELRSIHLGKEVVHSSAFILHLNQQIDNLCVDLREKDIDDSSVKVSLDKIKLVSDFFSDVNCTYKNFCQLFSERFDLTINSFKNSVLSNKFADSANNITKLNNARMILHDHLDHEHMQVKYVELQKYFLDYLNDAVKKLDNILTKDKLEKTDIGSFNNCVCMLESATNTFALEPHISMKDIGIIYENLLSQILNYVEEIIKKIDIQFKKENSFHVLEQYMEQLDSIRTISVINFKTRESYWKTLEKLVGYIQEAKRLVEEQLRILFRREEKVDYNKLIKCLSSLKGAKWIEKYRNGVYSDVINDVEQQLIEYVKALKESVMDVDLDLDNFDKIKQVHDIILEINEMKPIEKMVFGVSEYINAVNSWFEGVTNNVFTIIKDTFNIENWKEQGYQTVDFNKAEKAFSYLDICRNLKILIRTDCMSVLNGLEGFIRYYCDTVQKEMENYFDFITQFQNQNKKELFEKARIFANRLRELIEIKTCNRVYSCFSNKRIAENCLKDLSNYLIELADEMERSRVTQQIEILSEKSLVAKALSGLDEFLQTDKYNTLYTKYQSVFFSETNEISKQVIDAIKTHDYEQVSLDMATLQSSSEIGQKYFEQARRALIVGLENLIEETKTQAISLGNNIGKEQIQPIVENLKRLQKAKQFVSKFFQPEEIDKCIEEVKQLIEERIKRFLEGVKALITINNFYEADKKVDSITLVRSILGNYCTPDISKQIDELKERQNKVVLEDLVTKYSAMDLSSYTLNPPTDIFAKFEEVNNTNPVYHKALNIIKERILDKFRNELEQAKSHLPPNPENFHIRKFESAVKHLPDEMRNALEVELKHCKDDIALLIRDNNTKLEDALKSGDLNSIGNVLEEYQKSNGMQCYVNRGREVVLKQMQELTLIITQNFEKHEIAEALKNVKKLYDYKIKLKKVVDGIKQPYSDVRSRIKSTFQEAYLCFTNRFLNNNNTDISNDTIETVEKSFICLIEFLKFNYEHRDQSILTDMLPDDFTEKTVELNKNILQYLTEQQKKNDDALEKPDVTSLKNALDTLNRWNSLFMKMKSYDNTHSINDPFMIPITNAIKELKSYPEMLKLVFHPIEKLRDELIDQELINSDTKQYKKQRNEFYRKLNEKFLFLQKTNLFDRYGMSIEIRKIEQECLVSLEKKISNIFSLVQNLVEKLLSASTLMKQDSDNFNLYYNNFLSFKQEMKVKGVEIDKKIEIIQEKVFQKIQTWEELAENETNIENIAMYLINMKRTSNNMPSFAIEINERIDKVINHCKKRKNCPINLGKLCIILQQDETGVGSRITSEHQAFEGYSLSIFNEKTRRHGIEYVLDNLNGDLIDRNRLRKRYDEFYSIYQSLIKQHLKKHLKLDILISNTILITGNIKLNSDCVKLDAHRRAKIPNLAAHVFALWTLQNATHYFEADGVDNKENSLRQPYAAQIISIFRMLGIGDKDEELKNNLVQIGTGGGKSITLGATAAILALLGFDVRCACYSEYLSQRDYTAFRSLFDSLGLLEYIHYGNFNKLCEDMINENGGIRQTVEQLISKGSNNTLQNNQQTKRPKILLIDEVDVFFSQDFYGNVYTPSASLRDQTITSLINLIWKERNSRLNLKKVKNTDEYKACCNRFPNWEPLIQEAIKDMLFDVNNFQSHDYVVNQDKIGYIEQDNVIYNVVFGYKTLFAYYCEHEKGTISRESLEENISINTKCGSFSYAEIPLDFKYIMGVTGTLKTLSEPEIRVIENVYKIMKKTYTPSVFSQNYLRFIEKYDIGIENESDYFNVIRREIDDRLIGRSSAQRAVLVLFESKQKLKEFYNSEVLKPIKSSIVSLTEEGSLREKEDLIKRATTSGQITLLTRTFGRGTDFVCHDQRVSASGGVHVIQTFLSEELSEEVQIKGRTARQGDYGSYSMILLDRELEKFQIEKEHIEDVKKGKPLLIQLAGALNLTKTYDTVYDLLNDKRIDLFKTQYEANMKYVEQAKERHLSARKFLLNLNSGDIDSVRKFLVDENRGAEGNLRSRTVCLMDATGSMTHLLHKCKNTVDIMVSRASEILEDNGISSNSFQIQFVVYRNYNSKEDKILQSSPWETKPDNLRAFMNTIEVEGGWSNEAIEIGLWHANRENEREPITQVILIGDAPPNTRDEVQKKREHLGENYWKKTRFAQATYYENELARLISNNIPVHAFFVHKNAEVVFKTIAHRTNGRCEMLDINSSSGSQMLTDFVTEEILRSFDRTSKGNDLVQAYRDKFWKS